MAENGYLSYDIFLIGVDGLTTFVSKGKTGCVKIEIIPVIMIESGQFRKLVSKARKLQEI